jgi:radical SAM protein with 4Fe4S-binding SPASM domain
MNLCNGLPTGYPERAVIKPYSALKDLFRLAGCITPKRILNLIHLTMTWWMARLFKMIRQSASPVAISVEPTTRCNLRCPECPSGLRQFSRPQGFADLLAFTTWIQQMKHQVIWVNLYFQGEPMLHPQFTEMIGIAKKASMYVMTSTNGHFLTEETCHQIIDAGLDRLVVSLDGLDQLSYSAYRKGGDLATVLEGIDTLCRIKAARKVSHPYLILQTLILSTNEHQIHDFKQWIRRKGVDEVQLKRAQFYQYSEGNPLMPVEEKHRRYAKTASGDYALKSSLPNHCRRMWFSAVITWDGRVLPCCYDKDGEYVMGKLSENTLQEIWRSEAYRRFRRKLLTDRKGIPICNNCGEGLS